MGDKVPSKNSQKCKKIVELFKELPSEDKISALDGVIDACEAPELKYLSDRLEIFLKRDFVRFLPTEICMYLLGWLDPESLGRCCLVSKTWNEAVSECQPVWIRSCRSIGWKVDESITSGSYWKRTYQHALTRLKQLKNGSAFSATHLLGHTARVYSVCYNGRDVLASGSDDRSVRLWDVATGECLQVIQTHTCADLAFDEFFVYTASFDNTIACWKWDTGDLVRNYRGHTGAVFSISYDGERDLLVSGSADKTVRLWQISTGEQINMYHGHREWVTKVILRKSEVESLHHKPGDFVILSMDKIQIRIWLISQEINCESLCELSATDFTRTSTISTRGVFSYPIPQREDDNNEHCFLHPQLLFDGSRIMCSSERGVLEWDFKDYTLTRVTPFPNDPSYLLGAGKTMLLAADTCENCLFIRVHGPGVESQRPSVAKFAKTNPVDARSTTSHLSPSPETVDYGVEQDPNKPCCSNNSPINRSFRLPKFSSRLASDADGDCVVTPTDDSVEMDQSPQMMAPDDEIVNDINYNNIRLSKVQIPTPQTSSNINGYGDSLDPTGNSLANGRSEEVRGILGKWKLPMCRWSKRGSNYVCGDQSWLNGFSDINHSGLVFAAALPDHSIYLLRWSDCT